MSRPDEPDSPVAAAIHPSPNHGERRNGRRPDMVLLHYTGMATAEEALARLCDPAAEVSCHYFVAENGRVLQLVPEARRAWHAGQGAWAGERDINSCSVGIEIAHPGHDGGLPPYPAVQVDATTRLVRDVARRWRMAAARILGHSDVAPARKEDPGERFPWGELARAGVGHWVEPVSITVGPVLTRGDRGEGVEDLQGRLAGYGYDLDVSGIFDDRTRSVVTAFQRHFRQARVDGIADPSTLSTLRALAEALSG